MEITEKGGVRAWKFPNGCSGRDVNYACLCSGDEGSLKVFATRAIVINRWKWANFKMERFGCTEICITYFCFYTWSIARKKSTKHRKESSNCRTVGSKAKQ